MNSYPQKPVVARPKNVSQGGCYFNRLLGLMLLLLCVAGLSPRATADTFKAVSATVLPLGSCQPGDTSLDPGETNTVSFVVQNISGADLTNVKASLTGANIVFQSGQQTIGPLANNASATVMFTFRSNAGCGTTVSPQLVMTTGDNNTAAGTITYGPFLSGSAVQTTYTFSNTSAITINGFDPASDKLGRATPYPSNIPVSGVPNVSGVTGERVSRVAVTLNNLTSSWTPDMQVLLVSPNGNVVLMANAGGVTAGTAPVNNVTLTFADDAANNLPGGAPGALQITSGSYKPTVYGTASFPSGTPALTGNKLSDFANLDSTGTWALYVVDDGQGDSGVIAGGWRLDITTTKVVCCGAGQTFPTITTPSDFTLNECGSVICLDASKNQVIGSVTVNDIESGSNLAVSATSSDQTIVKNSSLTVSSSGATRTITLSQPELNASGVVTITVVATDPDGHTAATTFKLTVTFVNQPPVISDVQSQEFNAVANVPTPPIPFTVTDVEQSAGSVFVVGNSANQSIVPDSNITISGNGSGSARTVTLTPILVGPSTPTVGITLTAYDPQGGVTTKTFFVKFSATAGCPTITPLSPSMDENTVYSTSVTVRSGNTGIPDDNVTITGITSTNVAVVPVSGVVFGGSGSTRTLTITPAANQSGASDISFSLNNGSCTTPETYHVVVNFKNQNPTISAISNQTLNENSTGTGAIGFTVGDAETAAANLAISTVVTSDTANLLNVTTGGSGANRTITIVPNSNLFGRAVVTVTVTDDNATSHPPQAPLPQVNGTVSTTFQVIVNAVNQPPVIAATPDQTFVEDSGVQVGDTAPFVHRQVVTLTGISPGPNANESLQIVKISASSSDTTIVGIEAVDPATLTVTGMNQTAHLNLLLQTHKYGTVTITLTLVDNGGTGFGGNNTTTQTFKVNVTPVNYAPTLTINPGNTIDLTKVAKNRALAVPISITDVETPAALMTVHATLTSADPLNVVQGILTNTDNSKITLLLNPLFTNAVNLAQLPYPLSFSVTATDLPVGTAGAQTVTQPFSITIQNIEPPLISVNTATQTVDQDTVAQVVLTMHDNVDLSTELRPLQPLVDPCKSASGQTYELSGQSSNTDVVSNDNILFGNLNPPSGTDAARTIAIVPTQFKSGTTTITITAVDSECLIATTSFTVTFRSIPHPPTIAMVSAVPVSVDEDKTTADSTTNSKLLEFTVNDVDSGPASVTVTADSGNHDLMPVAGIQIGNQGAASTTRTLTITPGLHQFGTTTITLTATDPTGLATRISFTLNVNHVNQPPTVDQAANLSLAEDPGQQTVTLTGVTAGSTGATANEASQGITVQWDARDKGSRTSTSDGSNNLIQGGTAKSNASSYDLANKKATIQFTPVVHAAGTSTITVYVTDTPNPGEPDSGNTAHKTTTMTFDVAIAFQNHLPVISFSPINSCDTPTGLVTAQTITINRVGGVLQPTQVIPVFVCDVESNLAGHNGLDLTLTALSSNQALVPNDSAHLQVGGSGGNRGITIVPAQLDAGGSGTVTLTVTDVNGGTATATISFSASASGCPSISAIPDQVTQINTDTDLIFFTVNDPTVPVGNLTVTVTSGDTSKVPNSQSNIQVGGSGATRAMIIRPATDATGTVVITVGVNNGTCTRTESFNLSIRGQPPTITSIPAQTVTLGGASGQIPFVVGDAITFPGLLAVGGASSDQTVIPNSNILILSAGGGNRTVTLLSGPKAGIAVVTLTVTNLSGATSSTSFNVTVTDNNTPPTIAATGSSSQTTTKNKPTSLINFVVGDKETPVANLTLAATSSNTTLVPNNPANIVVLTSANPSTRSIIINPATDQVGTTVITVTVTDGGGKTASTTFTLTVSPNSIANDFNGDGSQDIILEDSSGFLAAWFMSGDDLLQSSLFTPSNVGDIGWRVVGDGDFNGDGKPDLLFQYTDGSLAVWTLNGVNLIAPVFTSPATSGASWKAVATGDFNKDGKVDILFQGTDGTLAIWYMDGLNLSSVAILVPSRAGSGWNVVGTGDFNGDGNLDIVFQHDDGTLGIWYMMNSNNLSLAALLNPSTPGDVNWRAVGVIDLNGDGKPDLLFQNRATGDVAIWYMNGAKLTLGKLLSPSNPGGTWKIVAP